MEIKDYREKIDNIDKKIGALLNERLNACMEIGKLKKQQDLEIKDPAREEQILQKVSEAGDNEENRQAIREIYKNIFEESKRLQK